jgi:folate-binding protein YgfZ
MNGYRALREHAAWIDLAGRGKIRVSGEDRVRFLHAMTTNHVEQLAPGHGHYAFFLNSQGRILADVYLFHLGEFFLLDTEPETADKVFQHLDKYVIADDVTLSAETADWSTLGIEGPDAAAAVAALGAPVPVADYRIASWGARFVARAAATGPIGFRIFAPASERPALLADLAGAAILEADAEAARTVRIEHAKPRYGDEITERYLTQETGQLHAVNFNKGCYLGQEIVERVRSRAQIHRRLASVHIRSTIPPTPGTKLKVDGKDAGEIASAAFSPALDEVVALAYVRVEHEAARSEMWVEGPEPRLSAYLA